MTDGHRRDQRAPSERLPGSGPARWSLVVPVKPLAQAKSRLSARVGPGRERLALAVACDTVAAALACPRVAATVVVTDDPVAAPALSELGARVVPDAPDAGLNPALRHGAAQARAIVPATGVAAMSADLPALRADELTRVLDAAGAHRHAFVPDSQGTGTTFYAAAPGEDFLPEFGPHSRDRHATGARELVLDHIDSVRRDVDTPPDLEDALSLGVGPRTAEAAAGMLPAARPRR